MTKEVKESTESTASRLGRAYYVPEELFKGTTNRWEAFSLDK